MDQKNGNLRRPEHPDDALETWRKLDDQEHVVLRNWTAQDFSNIYVRFRPHLELHARKYLRDQYLVDEVIQDAFLYLLTALPELDSEVGVLRFLKWKIKMLSIDSLRAQQRNLEVSLNDSDNSMTTISPELSEGIERADDAALVRLALSQLSETHRAALVATVFKEKTIAEASDDMGLSENAFRQLLFRARKSFKIAFTGEAAVEGMSVQEALSAASRKHGRSILSVTAALLIVAGIGVVVPFNQSNQNAFMAIQQEQSEKSAGEFRQLQMPTIPESLREKPEFESSQEVALTKKAIHENDDPLMAPVAALATVATGSRVQPVPKASTDEKPVSRELIASSSARSKEQNALSLMTETSTLLPRHLGERTHLPFSIVGQKVEVELREGTIFQATRRSQGSSVMFDGITVSLDLDGVNVALVPTLWVTQEAESREGVALVSVVATDWVLVDLEGSFGYAVLEDSGYASKVLYLDFYLNDFEEVIQVVLKKT